MKLLITALRNVFRNKRRSILNLIALILAVGLMVLGLGWVQGYNTYVYGAMQDFEVGEVQMVSPGYLAQERRLPLDLALTGYQVLKKELKGMEEVKEASGRIDFSLKLSNRKESIFLTGRAIDPESEANTTVLSKYIDSGEYPTSQKGGILIGKVLARRMDLHPGDTVYLTAQDRYGVENFTDIRVAGIFNLGFPPIDKNVVFLDLSSAMTLLDMNDQVTRIVLRMKKGTSPEKGAAILKERNLPGDIYTWRTFAQATVSAVQADSRTFYMMLVVLYFLIVLGLLNSMSMSVHERTREIGTLRAIGMKRRQVIVMLMMESGWLALMAAVVAVLITSPALWYLGKVGIDISSQMPDNIPVPFGDKFHADFRVWHFLLSLGAASFSALLGTFSPAYKASRLSAADAMRGGGLG